MTDTASWLTISKEGCSPVLHKMQVECQIHTYTKLVNCEGEL